ncbi:hypothetical protein J4Q44_G00011950 [Coregonus suidteri]|uniref:Uncharacterized protein n=1 Tax=Coregonus suidteri TaxID=861788 RepID=A0AAN8MKD3_9TELE
MFHDPEQIAAAILLPKFKTTWTKDDATIRMGMDYIKDHLEEPLLQLGDGTSSSDEEDFYSAMKTYQAQESSKQLDGYLACSSDHMELLKSFPAVCFQAEQEDICSTPKIRRKKSKVTKKTSAEEFLKQYRSSDSIKLMNRVDELEQEISKRKQENFELNDTWKEMVLQGNTEQ